MKNKTKLLIGLFVVLTIVSCKGKEEKTDSADTAAQTETSSAPAKEEAKGKLTKEQENALVFGAVLTTRNDMSFDDLEAEEYKDASIQVLRSAWKVTDTATAKETLESLLAEGHRAEGDPMLTELRTPEAAEKNTEEFQAYEDEYAGAYNFPYCTEYSSSNSGMFCTPEKGDVVTVYKIGRASCRERVSSPV